jgi:hypothetical protein
MGSNPTPLKASKLPHYLDLVEAAEAPAAILRAVQSYLNAWPKERVDAVQKIDGGWAPFDWNGQPLRVNGVRDLRRIRDVIHSHCKFLRAAGMASTPDLNELDEFFCAATEKAENVERPVPQARTQALSSHQYVLDN